MHLRDTNISFAFPACIVSEQLQRLIYRIMKQSDHEGWILTNIYLQIQIFLCTIYIYIELFVFISNYNFITLKCCPGYLIQQILSIVNNHH